MNVSSIDQKGRGVKAVVGVGATMKVFASQACQIGRGVSGI